jgi:hypothetical protein
MEPEYSSVAAKFKAWVSAAALLGLRVRILPGSCLSLLNIVCCQVEVSATDRSLVQGSPTKCVWH